MIKCKHYGCKGINLAIQEAIDFKEWLLLEKYFENHHCLYIHSLSNACDSQPFNISDIYIALIKGIVITGHAYEPEMINGQFTSVSVRKLWKKFMKSKEQK